MTDASCLCANLIQQGWELCVLITALELDVVGGDGSKKYISRPEEEEEEIGLEGRGIRSSVGTRNSDGVMNNVSALDKQLAASGQGGEGNSTAVPQLQPGRELVPVHLNHLSSP